MIQFCPTFYCPVSKATIFSSQWSYVLFYRCNKNHMSDRVTIRRSIMLNSLKEIWLWTTCVASILQTVDTQLPGQMFGPQIFPPPMSPPMPIPMPIPMPMEMAINIPVAMPIPIPVPAFTPATRKTPLKIKYPPCPPCVCAPLCTPAFFSFCSPCHQKCRCKKDTMVSNSEAGIVPLTVPMAPGQLPFMPPPRALFMPTTPAPCLTPPPALVMPSLPATCMPPSPALFMSPTPAPCIPPSPAPFMPPPPSPCMPPPPALVMPSPPAPHIPLLPVPFMPLPLAPIFPLPPVVIVPFPPVQILPPHMEPFDSFESDAISSSSCDLSSSGSTDSSSDFRLKNKRLHRNRSSKKHKKIKPILRYVSDNSHVKYDRQPRQGKVGKLLDLDIDNIKLRTNDINERIDKGTKKTQKHIPAKHGDEGNNIQPKLVIKAKGINSKQKKSFIIQKGKLINNVSIAVEIN